MAARTNKSLTPEENAEIDKRVLEGRWIQCPKCELRRPPDVPCGCDPAALMEFSRAAVFDEGGICRPCAGGHHIHRVCVSIAGCKCQVGGADEAPLPEGTVAQLLMISAPMMREIEKVVAFADAHRYHPDVDPPPGFFAEHSVQLGPLRCVFSITEHRSTVVRHLSMSIEEGPPQVPHPATVARSRRSSGSPPS